MDEIQVDKPADEKQEITNEQLAAKLEVVANLLGLMMLALGGYPLSGDLVKEMVNRCGVEFDPTLLGANQRRIVMPSGPLPPPIKGS